MELKYVLKPRLQFKELQDNKILSIDIFIVHKDEDCEPDSRNCFMWATLDWQRGLDVWQSECIDPFLWSKICEQMLLGMKAAYPMLSGYCAGEPE